MKKIIALTLALIMSLTCFSIVGFAEETDGTEHLTEVPEGYVGIYTKNDLDNIRLNLSGNYILMNDIIFYEADYEENGSFYNNGEGWNPIGTSSKQFEGIFDGNGYSIYNLYINRTKSYQGLFGEVKNATIRKINLINVDLSVGSYSGGVCGYVYPYPSSSSISNCIVSGSISSGSNYIGGICGYYSSVNPISNCIVSGSISGKDYVGGICGYAGKSGKAEQSQLIEKSINASNVTANSFAGGICGKFEGYQPPNSSYNSYDISVIYKCINTGDINVLSEYAGGVAGKGSGYDCVEYCFNTGNITGAKSGSIVGIGSISIAYSIGASESGGVRGEYTGGTCYTLYVYYLDESNTSSEFGYPKTAEEMKLQSTYTNWKFDTVWTMEGRADYPYPELRDVPLVFPEELEHKHEYTSEITTEPTHLKEGVETFTCKCGDTYTEPVAKLTEHTYTSEVTKEATHLAEGETTYTCACGDTYTEAIAKLTKHTYEKVVTAPTCTAKGYTTYTCECGDSYTGDYVSEKGHSFSESWTTITTANCTQQGVAIRTCRVCDLIETQKTPAFGHSDKNGDNKCDECSVITSIPENSGNTEGSGETIIVEKDNVFTFLRSFLNTLIEFLRSLLKI